MYRPKHLLIKSEDVEQAFDAIYRINKEAKICASKASDAYDAGEHDHATLYSARKEALYEVKEAVINAVLNTHSDLLRSHTLHKIGGRIFHYLVFDKGGRTWKFHYDPVPAKYGVMPRHRYLPDWVDLDADPVDVSMDEDSDDSDGEPQDFSVESALEYLATKGFNANEALNTQRLKGKTRDVDLDVPWPCLDGVETEPGLHEGICEESQMCDNPAAWSREGEIYPDVCDEHKLSGIHGGHQRIDDVEGGA